MSWIKKLVLNSGAPKIGVVDVLCKNLGGFEKARSHEVVHASDITKPGFCPRQFALMDITGKKPKDQYIGTALRATFDIGTITAKILVEQWAGKEAVGNWKCGRCDDTRTMCNKPGQGCAKNGTKCRWEYLEPRFVSKEFGVDGSIDLLIDLQSQKWVVVELKIIKPEDFSEIVAPLPEHRIRTSLYLKLIADSDSIWKDKINLHEARVLYVSRGYGKKNPVNGEIIPFREFVVTRDDSLLTTALARAKQIHVFREGTPLVFGPMPSGICATALDKTAKGCPVCAECFSGEHPAKQEKLV